ncbi:MAG: hypothetical protein J6S42_00195, partial [Thermoguttaceae bacterium]|nr:hypothetical protein [Thermoguttaceae bacterium]
GKQRGGDRAGGSGVRRAVLRRVHDELLLETHHDAARELAELVSAEMLLGQPLRVPLKIDTEFTETW